MLMSGDEGDNADNVYVHTHAQGAWSLDEVEIWLRRHHGALGVDSPSPRVNRAAWKPLRDAIIAGAADNVVNTHGRAAFGAAWWDAHLASVPDAMAALRVDVLAATT